ncbi:MAG: TIR domain-containing protein [Okeania sp. SIO2H7]|nr:TIR domain-containing protein [Okeania sp. SIO2H7]
MVTFKASKEGLIKIKQSRVEKGWAISDYRWLEEATKIIDSSLQEQGLLAVGISIGTWKRFLAGKSPINAEAFQAYCQVLGLEWKEVVEEIGGKVTDSNFKKSTRKKQRAKIFISYGNCEPDISLSLQFYQTLKAAKHEVFLAGESIKVGEEWPKLLTSQLQQSDYFLLLLSPQCAMAEMVTEEVKLARDLGSDRPENKPVILPIRVNFPVNSPLNYELRSYLDKIPQREWKDAADTPILLEEILNIAAEGNSSGWEQKLINTTSKIAPNFAEKPTPSAEPELPGGQVKLASKFYVERPPIEENCYETIQKPGALIRIKAARQMGKTSLMARILYRGRELGYRTVSLSFQLANRQAFSDVDRFLKWFSAMVAEELGLSDRLSTYWKEHLGVNVNCKSYFEKYLLPEINTPLVLGLDEVDRVFQHPEIAEDFFSLLRVWHEAAKEKEIWQKLRLVVVHSTEVYLPMNVNQSPFNVGLPIDLPEFTPEQILSLARRHELNWTEAEADKLIKIVGGHPFLVRVALYQIKYQDLTLENVLETAVSETGLYGDHLRRHLWNLQQHPELAESMKKVVNSNEPVQLQGLLAFKLNSMGLVNLEGNKVKPRCHLYRQYLIERLGNC